MGCCNSLNSVHPSSQPVGETNPSFGIQDACTTDTDHDLPLVAPNSSPERPVRHNGVGKVRSSVSPALEALSQLENNKTFYRPKLVKQFGLPSSSSSDETDGRYSNGVQLFRSNGSQLSQKFDKMFESLEEAELDCRRRSFPQKPVETESQIVFFKILDKKIAEGPDYVPD